MTRLQFFFFGTQVKPVGKTWVVSSSRYIGSTCVLRIFFFLVDLSKETIYRRINCYTSWNSKRNEMKWNLLWRGSRGNSRSSESDGDVAGRSTSETISSKNTLCMGVRDKLRNKVVEAWQTNYMAITYSWGVKHKGDCKNSFAFIISSRVMLFSNKKRVCTTIPSIFRSS